MANRTNEYRRRRLLSLQERVRELEKENTHLKWELQQLKDANHYLETRLNDRMRMNKWK